VTDAMSGMLNGLTNSVVAPLMLESAIRAAALGVGVWIVLRLVKVRRAVHVWSIWTGVLAVSALMPLLVVLTARLFADVPGEAIPTSLVKEVATAATDLGIGGRAIGFAYLMVAGLLLLRIAIGVFALARAWRAAQPIAGLSSDAIPVRCSKAVATPVATGSGILLPVDWMRWSAEARACVLTHEISHLVRKDFYWQLLAQLYAALFWFSPFPWLLHRKLSVLAEHVSDDAAIAATGRPVDYAATLLQFAGRRQHSVAVGMARRATVSQRIERILRASPAESVSRVERTALALCMVPTLLLSTLSPRLRVMGSADRPSRPLASIPTAAPLQPLNTPRIARLNTSNVARLNTSNVARLNTSNVARLNTSNVARLNTSNVARLNTSNVARLNTSNVARLNTSRVAPLR
jgi:beta-lactamase regulating signal transducer with metallopeptidase domain